MTIDGFPTSGILLAVIEFGGFASEKDFTTSAATLRAALQKDRRNIVEGGPFSEAWAGYNAPNVVFNRHNEVWIQVTM